MRCQLSLELQVVAQFSTKFKKLKKFFFRKIVFRNYNVHTSVLNMIFFRAASSCSSQIDLNNSDTVHNHIRTSLCI